MNVQSVAYHFVNAAKAIMNNIDGVSITGTGVKILNFETNGKPFSAIEQNKGRNSLPARLAQEGKPIFQIKDNESQQLIGFVNVEDNTFNAYGSTGANQIDINEVEKALGPEAIAPEDVRTVAATTGGSTSGGGNGGNSGQNGGNGGQEGNRSQALPNRPRSVFEP